MAGKLSLEGARIVVDATSKIVVAALSNVDRVVPSEQVTELTENVYNKLEELVIEQTS